jgi:hypothetical protein
LLARVFLCSDGADAAILLRPRFATPGYGSLLLVLYRVFDLPEELRTRLRAKRAKATATTAQVVQTATADCLPKLVAALRELGFRADGKTRPARIPMTACSLRALRRASKKTGLPACRLLFACIAIACDEQE